MRIENPKTKPNRTVWRTQAVKVSQTTFKLSYYILTWCYCFLFPLTDGCRSVTYNPEKKECKQFFTLPQNVMTLFYPTAGSQENVAIIDPCGSDRMKQVDYCELICNIIYASEWLFIWPLYTADEPECCEIWYD
jgi:hypothetical protein